MFSPRAIAGFFAAILLAPMSIIAQEKLNPWRVYPETESTFAQYVDNINSWINAVCIICFIGIIIFMVIFAVKFRRRDPHQKALSQASHNTALELSWTLPPLVIVFVMFYYGFVGFLRLNTPPDNAYVVEVTASKWAWTFRHRINGRIDAKETVEIDGKPIDIPAILHVPAGEPVVVEIGSTDVLHSLGIPAFRVKKDAVPGRKTYLWFEAINPTPGHYDQHADVIAPDDPDREAKEKAKSVKLADAARRGHIIFCSEFCGTDHSNMLARVVVHPKGWRPADEPMPTEHPAKGKFLFNKTYACSACHSTVAGGPVIPGPNFFGLFGRDEQLASGGSVTVDEAYIGESIRSPQAKLVKGYGPLMPQTFATMSEDHVVAIVEYLKSLGPAKTQ